MTKQQVIKQAQQMTESQVKQALNDASACQESRRVSRLHNRCDCFCCVLDQWLRGPVQS